METPLIPGQPETYGPLQRATIIRTLDRDLGDVEITAVLEYARAKVKLAGAAAESFNRFYVSYQERVPVPVEIREETR